MASEKVPILLFFPNCFRPSKTPYRFADSKPKRDMDALQRASQLSNPVEISDEGSKTIKVPLIVRNAAGRFPCPSKTCTKDYSRASYARNRFRRVHINVSMRVACPDNECGKTFFDLHTAKEHHMAGHDLLRYDCPPDACIHTFTSPRYAQKHYKAVHLLNRIACAFPGCIDTFSFASAMKNHMSNLHAPRWTCPVQNCANTASEHGVSHNQIAQHMDKHERLGHLTGLQNSVPKQLSSVSTDITARKEELKTLLLTLVVGHAHDGFESEDVVCDDSEVESQRLSDDEWTSDCFPTSFGMEIEEIIKVSEIRSSRHEFTNGL